MPSNSDKEGVKVSGETAQGIVANILNANDISITEHPEKLEQIAPLYNKYMKEFMEAKKITYEALPNVHKLLDYCHKSDDFDLALVTGNAIDGAEVKLRAAGINPDIFKRQYEGEFKLIGGFGSDDIYRQSLKLKLYKIVYRVFLKFRF